GVHGARSPSAIELVGLPEPDAAVVVAGERDAAVVDRDAADRLVAGAGQGRLVAVATLEVAVLVDAPEGDVAVARRGVGAPDQPSAVGDRHHGARPLVASAAEQA